MLDSGIYKKEDFNIPSTIEITSELTKETGSIMTFTGIVKEIGKDDKKVVAIEIETYDEHANDSIKKICDEIKMKYNLTLAKIFHFKGYFKVGEPLVFVIVAAKHRNQTYFALQEAIERYKKEPAIWKKEIYAGGNESWIDS